MLFSPIKHGTSKCLMRRPFPNDLSTTKHRIASSHSTQGNEQSNRWTTIPKHVQNKNGEGLRQGGRQVGKECMRLDGSNDTSNSLEVAPGWAPGAREWPRRGKEDLKAPEAGSPEENTIDADSVVQRIGSSYHERGSPGKNANIPTQHEEEDDNRADSSFLDQLHKDEVRRAGPNVSVSEKLSRLRDAMAARRPQALLKYMVQASEDLDFMNAIPEVTFIELLRQLHPEDDFSPLRSEYKGLGPKNYGMLLEWRDQFYKALRDRRQSYQDIAFKRIASGRELGLGEYTQLLNLARATWDGPTALDVMKEMIAGHMAPDLLCYNHYFEARCWSDAYHPDEAQRLRVIPYNLEMRKSFPNRRVSNDVWVDGHRVEENGIRWEITRMFTKMINDGINADTRAYCNLIIAQSREGDLRAIKSVLYRVWQVDIDKLLAGAPDSDRNKLAEDSPTYPTKELLFTLAHAFGSNNDMPAAIRIVDHFSRKYSITIPQLVWGELMQWTFVLSARRRKTRRLDGTSAGQLPLISVESLWNVMRGPPYESEPNLLMYDYLIRSFFRRDRRSLYAYIEHMREGIKLHEQECDAYDAAQREAVTALRQGEEILDYEDLDARKLEAEALRGKRWFSFALVRKWFQLLLANQRWLKEPWEREVKWSRKMLPDAVKEFWRHQAHRPITYPMAGGRVELHDPVAKQEWAIRKMATEERLRMDVEEWEARQASRMEGQTSVRDDEWTEEEREILEDDERESDQEAADESDEEIRRELDDL